LLSDVLILDLSAYLPGPFASGVLADLGARVVKVEPPRGDPTRAIPPHDAQGVSAAYGALNRGKESLALDLKSTAGVELLLDLTSRFDVLLEGFRPGVMERLGLGPEVCLARNPRLVYCRLTGYGQSGPYRDQAGHDLNYQAYSGSLALGAGVSGPPATPGIQTGDLLGGYAAAVGILAALRGRSETAGGRVVDVSILDALVQAQGIHFAGHRLGLRARAREMPLNGGVPCYDVYEVADGEHVALGALEPKFWATFCEIVAKPEWLARGYDLSLRPEVAALFKTQSRDAWRVVLENADCCFSPLLSYDEVIADDHVQARGVVERQSCLQFDPPPEGAANRLSPEPGSDREALLQELLELDAAAQADLAQRGAFGPPRSQG
jgi:alpha-methylacyl-CoA racemase